MTENPLTRSLAEASSKWSFDKLYWGKVISRPDWYLEFVPYAEKIKEELKSNPDELDAFLRVSRHFFEDALVEGKVALAEQGPDFDVERKPIDTVVIHHTSAEPGYRLSYMNAVQLLNIYAPNSANPPAREAEIKGKPIWSGHFRDGKPSFLVYHWLMRMDGSFERLLEDNQIGWQAGNWDINCRSIGVCIDNDYDNRDPDSETIQKLAEHIKVRYPKTEIIGHCESNGTTSCPGQNFLRGWKDKLQELTYVS